MIIKDFSGGIHWRKHPSQVPSHQAVVYTNIDNEKSVLVPHKKDSIVTPGPEYLYWHWFTKADAIISRPDKGTFIEYRQWLYYFMEQPSSSSSLAGAEKGLKYDKDNLEPQKIGVNKPSSALELVSAEDSAEPTYKGFITYTYTFYNEETDIESAPAEKLSIETQYENDVILTIKGFEQPPEGYDIRLYRIDDVMIDFNLVDTIDRENYANEYRDENVAIEVAGEYILDSYSNLPPKEELKYVIMAHNVFIGAIDNKVYYSKDAQPDYWPEENFLEFDTDITGLAEVQNGILVFTEYKTYIVTGTSSKTFVSYVLNGNIGCINFYSIQYINNGAIWHSTKGIVWSNGGNIELISYAELGEVSFKSFSSIAIHRQYLLHTSIGLVIADFRLGFAIRIVTIVENKTWLGLYKNNICYKQDNFYRLFGSLENRSIHYKSGIISLAEFSTRKTFKDIYIKYKAPIKMLVYLDGRKVFERALIDRNSSIQFEEIKLRSGLDGYGLEIELQGTGEVYEIQLKAHRREK